MELIPAILEESLGGLQAKLDALAELADVGLVQIDVADGTLTHGSSWHEAGELGRLAWRKELELHLMQAQPLLGQWLDDSRVTRCVVHAEASAPQDLLRGIQATGKRAGLAINPGTEVAQVKPLLGAADYILLLTVEPGSQGQAFKEDVLGKVAQIHAAAPGLPVYVDGGVNDATIGKVREAGCAGAAVGSYLWRNGNPGEAMASLWR